MKINNGICPECKETLWHDPEAGEALPHRCIEDYLDVADATFWAFSQVRPHAAYDADPDKFWEFFKQRIRGVTREEMVELLKDTRGEK